MPTDMQSIKQRFQKLRPPFIHCGLWILGSRANNQAVQRLRPLYPLWILEGVGQLSTWLVRTVHKSIVGVMRIWRHPKFIVFIYLDVNTTAKHKKDQEGSRDPDIRSEEYFIIVEYLSGTD